ncbi:MAG: hypothetical protein ACI4ES_05890, partial [Roseburia sp.]
DADNSSEENTPGDADNSSEESNPGDADNSSEAGNTTEDSASSNENNVAEDNTSSEANNTTENSTTNNVNGTITSTTNVQTTTEKVTEKIANASNGETVSVAIGNEEETIPASIFNSIAGKDITLELALENGVVWKINGKDITSARDLSIGVELNSNHIAQSVLNTITDDGMKSMKQVSLDYDGEFGMTATISVPLGTEGAGYYANLYYYNPQTGALEYMQTVKIGADGKADFTFTHASDYVITISETDMSKSATVQTGDETDMVGYVLLILTGIAVLSAVIAQRRKIAFH